MHTILLLKCCLAVLILLTLIFVGILILAGSKFKLVLIAPVVGNSFSKAAVSVLLNHQSSKNCTHKNSYPSETLEFKNPS